jgi:hypothetical protein
MKRKITYLLKDYTTTIKKILLHTSTLTLQADLIKNKQSIFDEIDKMAGKYDKIIKEIRESTGEDEV